MNYAVYETDIGARWYEALVEQCRKNNDIYEKDRLYNFPDDRWSEAFIVDELNASIRTLNDHNAHITGDACNGMPQETLNALHHDFERLRGAVLEPGEFWRNANETARAALERFNVLIHRAEYFYGGDNGNRPRIVCSFEEHPRYELKEEDYRLYTLEKRFGEIYINYCEVGKPLQDVFKDRDAIIGDDNIRPLRYYSCDFTSAFYDTDKTEIDDFLKAMDGWWDTNEEHLSALGFKKNDPGNAIGNIPVGMLESPLAREDVIGALCRFNTMDRVELV